ncbi:hypothetical protein ESR_15543, partial [Eschrichtius robustus]|nr:hypothetical protein [Eschrichtius robustus]
MQVIEVVKPAGHPCPDPLEEGISFDIYSTFIEPPPILDMEMKGLNQEQGPEESQPEADTSEIDPLVGFTIEDIKLVLGQVTDDILISIQLMAMYINGVITDTNGCMKMEMATAISVATANDKS